MISKPWKSGWRIFPILGTFYFCFAAGTAKAETLAEKLIAQYDGVQSLQCQLRRDTEAAAGKMRKLSRIYFQRADKLHVDNVTPLKRRIVCDGMTFFSYIEGDPKGFSRPVSKLDEDMLVSLRQVPGTAMDQLLRLKGVAETNLPAAEGFPVRRGYDKGKTFVVLALDASNRLARIEFFTTSAMQQRTARYDYGQFQEVMPGVAIPCLQQAVFSLGGVESRETVHVDNLVVNQPIPANLFQPSQFFKGVQFADSFEEIYK
ncbi:MAG: hypothetical protein EPN23_08050 [Verrucomicrobia bacterium]|nr:MAG: hypothetical protein EPN23_08050 [Verrucomicrobiota bacterium]